MFDGISMADTFSTVKEISKGMSGDRKYYIETTEGRKLLLRITEASNYETKKRDYDFLFGLKKANLPVPEAIEFGVCENGKSVYMILEWMEGEEAEKVVPNMDKEKQYSIGVKSGQILRGIHENSTMNDRKQDWYERYFAVLAPRIESYKNEGVPFDGTEEILSFIEKNKYLLHDRRQCNIHGDYHLGNLIINDAEEIFVIDWQTVDFEGSGDPWVDFINIGVEHPAFAAGQIDGYFNYQVPEEFWRILALYLSASAITSIVWAKYFAPDRLENILALNRNILSWYDKMNTVIPAWYKAYMTKQEAITLFQSMHPNFFEQEYIQSLSEDWVFDEMILRLEEFDMHKYEKSLDTSITFGFFEGNREALLRAVEQVDSDWVEFFGGEDRVLCGYLDGKVVSFCHVENMGTYKINGKTLKIGGPGCVGTLPEYRDKGIGLMMVKKATQILKDEGYDYSYIHYTYVAQWYAKLGYETVLKWTKNGIL